jgi:hypothetical protein
VNVKIGVIKNNPGSAARSPGLIFYGWLKELNDCTENEKGVRLFLIDE